MRISAEPFDAPEPAALRAEGEADIAARYGGVHAEPGPKPTAADVVVFLVARDDDGTAVGCGALRRIDAETAELKRMYVRPAARRRGVARALLGALEDAARGLGATRVRLETGPAQPEAIALYTGAGYQEVPCAGPYAASAESSCYERSLAGTG